MTRIGKVKIYSEEGKLLRHGVARENDFSVNKILGIFTGGELIKGSLLTVGIIFGAGMIWANIDAHLKTNDDTNTKFSKSLDDFKTMYWTGHKELISIMQEQQSKQDIRINCLSANLKGCCTSAGVC